MSALAMMVPIAVAAAALAVAGLPSDVEVNVGICFVAFVACLSVAVSMNRRRVLLRAHPYPSEGDHLLRGMLRNMTVVALCVAWLMLYRGAYALAQVYGATKWVQWFLDNRLIGAAIIAALAASMAAKLEFQSTQRFGRWWATALTSIGAALFVGAIFVIRAAG